MEMRQTMHKIGEWGIWREEEELKLIMAPDLSLGVGKGAGEK